MLKAPFQLLVKGVRAVDTITADVMFAYSCFLLLRRGREMGSEPNFVFCRLAPMKLLS
jgi:hypothetical protein